MKDEGSVCSRQSVKCIYHTRRGRYTNGLTDTQNFHLKKLLWTGVNNLMSELLAKQTCNSKCCMSVVRQLVDIFNMGHWT